MATSPTPDESADVVPQKPKRATKKAVKKAASKKSSKRVSKETRVLGDLSSKGMPWTFPKNSLEDAIRIAKAIEDKNAGNPMPAGSVAKATGFRQASDWRFLELLRSANQYGLVEGSGAAATIALTKLGQDLVAPSEPTQRSEALKSAFRNVESFKSVQDFYRDKRLPEDEYFLNTLTRQFSIPRDRVDVFASVFRENVSYLRPFFSGWQSAAQRLLFDEGVALQSQPGAYEPAVPNPTQVDVRVREYLDTCFVMMPFGDWFDRYYQDIYVPAIKEAGFEPVRADELFSTGSVVDQIWEQISKAKVLLADLSGKNANVFYELGLSHAAGKPVVFTASQVSDVPFDLRHLRVIVYEVREPNWAVKLQKSVTDYLKNASKEPEKSIPHPFRISTLDGSSNGIETDD